MKRLILLLSALAGAAGCHSHTSSPPPGGCSTDGTLTVYWQPPQGGFTTATGQLLGCDAAGVVDLDLYVNGQLVASHQPCHGQSADGVRLIGFTDETVDLQVDAYDASNLLLYSDVTSVNTTFCADTVLDVTLAATQAPFTVAYSLPGGNACPTGSYVWYSLVDVTGNAQFALVDLAHSPTSVPCGTTLTFDQALFGQYRLDFIQVVTPTGIPQTPFGANYEYCSPLLFNHNADNDTLVVPTLSSASGLCQ